MLSNPTGLSPRGDTVGHDDLVYAGTYAVPTGACVTDLRHLALSHPRGPEGTTPYTGSSDKFFRFFFFRRMKQIFNTVLIVLNK